MSDSEWDSHDDDDDNAAVAVAAARSTPAPLGQLCHGGLPRRAGAIKTEDDAVSVAESFATAVSRAPTGASRPPAPRPARTAPLPAASAATNLAVSAVTPAAAPLHANDEAAKAIARIYGRLAPELAAQRLSMDIASVDVILAMGGDAEVRLRSVMDRLVAVRLVATAQWVAAARQQSERIVAAIMDAGPGVASTRAVAAASQSVADRADTPTSRGLVPDASGNDHSVAAADDHHDDDDRGSISYKSEAFDDDESMPESDWDLREAAALRHEAEVRAFAPPPDPIFYLGNTRISSADYACPRQLRKTALSHAEPRPLNLVVRIVENKPSKKNGTSQYRLMKVDLGDGVMDMLANVGSDLYNIDKKNNAFPIDAIVILEDVRGVFRGRALALDFWPFSRISRCDDEWRRLGNQGS